MRVRIHRGAREVGGSCVEVEAEGWRVVLDVGLPLEPAPDAAPKLPAVPGLSSPDGRTALFVTHGHPDHHGLVPLVHGDVPLFMGAAAQRILAEAAFFTGAEPPRPPTVPLRDGSPIRFGPFTVTPLLADHSAFDAYSLLVEAAGRRLLYSGDLRGHGRKSALARLLREPPAAVDVLLREGTHVRANGDLAGLPVSETDVERACAATFRDTKGLALACYSAQNIDRLVTLYRATRRAGREFVMDLYTTAVAAGTGRQTIPQAAWDGVRVFLPRTQRRRVIDGGEFWRTDAVRAARIYPEELRERPHELVMTFRASMRHDLERAGCLAGAAAVWSLWPGYLERDSGRELRAWLAGRDIELATHHASGHASVSDLRRLVDGVRPGRVVPIHTWAPNRFPELFPCVELRRDLEWWEV